MPSLTSRAALLASAVVGTVACATTRDPGDPPTPTPTPAPAPAPPRIWVEALPSGACEVAWSEPQRPLRRETVACPEGLAPGAEADLMIRGTGACFATIAASCLDGAPCPPPREVPIDCPMLYQPPERDVIRNADGTCMLEVGGNPPPPPRPIRCPPIRPAAP